MAMQFQFFTLHHLWVLAFAGLNIIVGQANGVMPWLLMQQARYNVDFNFMIAFHSLCMHINQL